MDVKFRILFLLLTLILLIGIAVPCVLAQHFEYNTAISLTPTNRVDIITVNMNYRDTLWYEFKATELVTFWVEDPTDIQILPPYNYSLSDYVSPLELHAMSNGTYSLKFSLPQGVPNNNDDGYTTLEIKYGFDRYGPSTTSSSNNGGLFNLVSLPLLIIMAILAVIAAVLITAIGLNRKAEKNVPTS